jgi:prolyl-tRNA synthetase
MRWSRLYIPTLREDPAEADARSHELLLRAGYIRQLMAGHYTLLPLATRVRAKVIAIIREEMNAIGSQEFLLPTMHPADIWKRTGRWESLGELLFRLRDRKGADMALGVTHEEIFTVVSSELSSYRQLPQMWYQFQTKYRDEPRPKAGLMRTREFTMKDSYSFDLTPEGLDLSFDAHQAAYQRIFERLSIPAIPVEASSGAMGGSTSTEFMCPSDAGEDDVVHCPACGYAANMEKATSKLAEIVDDEAGPDAPEQFDTPGVRSIEDLAVKFGAPADRQVKTLVFVLDGQLSLVLMRGDHAMVEQKLIDATAANMVRPAHPEEIKAALGATPGSLGAVGIADVPVIADEALRGRRNMFTGANIDGVHLRGVDIDRDITVGRWADLRAAVAGEQCPACGEPLQIQRAMEVGHIFKLGYKYTESLDVTVLDAEGNNVRPIMGSYGIGVERAMAAIVECHNDEKGIIWPKAVAPFQVAIVLAQMDNEVTKVGDSLYQQLLTAGVEVVLDDRPDRAGVKFRDVELVGIPVRVTVGSRGLAEGKVDVTIRATGETKQVAIQDMLTGTESAIAAAP